MLRYVKSYLKLHTAISKSTTLTLYSAQGKYEYVVLACIFKTIEIVLVQYIWMVYEALLGHFTTWEFARTNECLKVRHRSQKPTQFSSDQWTNRITSRLFQIIVFTILWIKSLHGNSLIRCNYRIFRLYHSTVRSTTYAPTLIFVAAFCGLIWLIILTFPRSLHYKPTQKLTSMPPNQPLGIWVNIWLEYIKTGNLNTSKQTTKNIVHSL